jgi:hypothetical protein
MFTGWSYTELAAFGCVDAVQSNTLAAVDLNCIAINDVVDGPTYTASSAKTWSPERHKREAVHGEVYQNGD